MKVSFYSNAIFLTSNRLLIILSILFLFLINSLNAAASGPSKHEPFAQGKCEQCHTDKKGEGELREEMPDLCYSCHDDYENKNFMHGPVAAGACNFCHDPHKSDNPGLLVESSVTTLCTSCHIDKQTMLDNDPVIHPPVKDSCTNCHDPHAEDHRFQLKADRKKDLCLGCHTEKKEWIENSKYKHGAVDRGDQCIGCHNPHSSQQPKLLQADNSKDLCMKCHNAALRTIEDQKLLLNMADHLEKNPDWHGPTLWGDCAACHNPHGSDNFRMLKRPFPSTSVSKFDPKNYICFQCHDESKATAKFTTEDTNFRNGDLNIHYVHVNGKGITCRTCHDFHGTREYPHHLRLKSSFGSAKFPIRYIETPDGGSCDPICHARKHYDREDPKINKSFR